MRLNPFYTSNYLGHLGNAYRSAGRYEDAIEAYQPVDEVGCG